MQNTITSTHNDMASCPMSSSNNPRLFMGSQVGDTKQNGKDE